MRVHLLPWHEGVVQVWGNPLHLFLVIFEVDVFPLALDSGMLPLHICFQLIQSHAVSV